MKNERRLIDVNKPIKETESIINFRKQHYMPTEDYESFLDYLKKLPTVDVVPTGAYEQVRRERDSAMKQLEEHGIPFGGIAPDVVKVVRCRDCIYYETGKDYLPYCNCDDGGITDYPRENDFCSYGERKDDDTAESD